MMPSGSPLGRTAFSTVHASRVPTATTPAWAGRGSVFSRSSAGPVGTSAPRVDGGRLRRPLPVGEAPAPVRRHVGAGLAVVAGGAAVPVDLAGVVDRGVVAAGAAVGVGVEGPEPHV